MSNRLRNGYFVLENSQGHVVRSFHIDARRFSIIYNEDTGRIESSVATADLDDRGVEYSLLAEVATDDIKKAPVAIGQVGQLKWVDDIQALTPRDQLKEQSDEFKPLLKKIAAINLGLLLFCIIINYFFPGTRKIDEPIVITLEIPKPEPVAKKPEPKQQPKIARQTVKPMPTRAKPKVVKAMTKPQVKPTVTIARRLRPTSNGTNRSAHNAVTSGQNINQFGALSVLGGKSNAPITGGSLNLKNVQAKLGSGGGGTGAAGNGGLGGAGSGGFANALSGKGLAAASRGVGGVGMPSGGYGTRGRAGGQNGYGRVNLQGGGEGYFQPLEQEAEIEGGLDMDQIAEVIEKNRGQIEFCYEQGLQMNGRLAGRVGVRFTIGGTGRVATAGVASSSMRAAQVEGCILSKLRGFRFPQPVGNVTVKVLYPFKFQRVSQR